MMTLDDEFWHAINTLVQSSTIQIDRPKGTAHPKFPSLIYPLDYGYLEGTTSGDGEGIDVWLGSKDSKIVDTIICTVDLWKRDMEIKLLIGCTQQEIKIIEQFLNSNETLFCKVVSRNIT